MKNLQKFEGKHVIIEMGSFGMRVTKVREAMTYNKDYAQYQDCLRLQYVESGKRKPVAFAKTGNPWVVIVKGDSIPEFDSNMKPVGSAVEGVSCSVTRHSCFSPAWKDEANAFIERNRANMEIVFEVR